MKSTHRFGLILACSGLLSAGAVSTAHAQFKCDGRELPRVDATACAKAAESATALRQFITRTQNIYGLQMSDYVHFDEEAAKVHAARMKADSQKLASGETPRSR